MQHVPIDRKRVGFIRQWHYLRRWLGASRFRIRL